MDDRGFSDDERAVSEQTSVAILVGLTVIVTATVGLNVLVVSEEDTGPPDANFTYRYIEESSALIITHSKGDEFPAGELEIEGPRNTVTWAEAASVNETTSVGPGDTVQISRGNAYGEPVSRSDAIRIYHATDGNRTQIGAWKKE